MQFLSLFGVVVTMETLTSRIILVNCQGCRILLSCASAHCAIHMQQAMSSIMSLTARILRTFVGSSGRCSRMLMVPPWDPLV